MFWFSVKHLSGIFLTVRRIERDVIKNIYSCIHVNFPVFLPDSNETGIFPTDYLRIFEYQIKWKSIQLETSCFHAYGRKDRWIDRHDETNSGCKQFCERVWQRFKNMFVKRNFLRTKAHSDRVVLRITRKP